MKEISLAGDSGTRPTSTNLKAEFVAVCRLLAQWESSRRSENKNGLAAMRRIVTSSFGARSCKDRGYPALPSAASAQSMRLFRGRTALRLWCRRRLTLLHLFLLSGMLLLNLLGLLSVALLHLLFLRVVVVFRGGLLVFFILLLLEFLMILRLLGS